ncbi:MAG TPA: hypothetical protein PK208_13675 [Fibrobacteria bacterium]|nr:hypothetical protein [Fibrobacteria bacterium]
MSPIAVQLNIFISEFSITPEFKRHASYSQAILAAMDASNNIGAQCFRSHTFTNYEQTEAAIDSSKAVIAIIDQYWTSSTWKCHELFHAGGGPSQHMSDKFGPKIPIIAYLTPDVTIKLDASIAQLYIHRSIRDFRNGIISTINEISI